MSELNVPAAIAKVMQALSKTSFVEDKKNKQSNYSYVSADQVMRRLQAAMGEVGLVIIPEVFEQHTEAFEYNRTVRYTTTIDMIMEVSTASDDRRYMWPGKGIDYGSEDKALYKAMTSGHKYFLLKTFNIGAGDDSADSEHQEIVKAEPAKDPVKKPAAKKRQPATKNNNQKPVYKFPVGRHVLARGKKSTQAGVVAAQVNGRYKVDIEGYGPVLFDESALSDDPGTTGKNVDELIETKQREFFVVGKDYGDFIGMKFNEVRKEILQKIAGKDSLTKATYSEIEKCIQWMRDEMSNQPELIDDQPEPQYEG